MSSSTAQQAIGVLDTVDVRARLIATPRVRDSCSVTIENTASTG
jgi:hypothetical protein